MKKVLLSLVMVFLVVLAYGQVPKKFNYQTVIRNADGTVRSNAAVTIGIEIHDLNLTGPDGPVVFEETHTPVTDEHGLVNLVIGENNVLDVSWAEGDHYLRVTVDGTFIGGAQLLTVPFAFAAENVVNNDDADPDPANELQDLNYVNNVLTITGNPGATPLAIPEGVEDSQWKLSDDSLTISGKNIGIGTNSPTAKLLVMGDGKEGPDEPLFEVKKDDGQTVFAVYNDRAEVYVNENPLAKGVKGGFAVGGYNTAKGTTTDIMHLTSDNYFIGHQSGEKITSGLYNSTLGYQAGVELTSGSENIFMGYQSGFNNIDGYQNTFLGYQSGFYNTSGFQNSFIGQQAGFLNTEGHNNMFMGYFAGWKNTVGNYNMFFGRNAGAENTSGEGNTFIGDNVGLYNTTGKHNIFFGPGAGQNNIDGEKNLFIGRSAGNYNEAGSNNLFLGPGAGGGNVDGHSNIYIGRVYGGSGNSSSNLFMGDRVGYYNESSFENTMIGYETGYFLIDGQHNTFMGYQAGYKSNGTENVYIGSRAGLQNSLGINNIFIGAEAGGSLTDSISNTLVIDNYFGHFLGNSIIYGKLDGIRELRFTALVGIQRVATANRLEVEGDASKLVAGDWLANSDMRIKTDIQDIENSFEVMLKLRPVKFRYTDEYMSVHPGIADKFYLNFLAQEYKEVFPEAVQSSGEILESAQDEILQMDSYNAQIYSVKAIQELIKKNEKQKVQIEELYKLITQLKAEQ